MQAELKQLHKELGLTFILVTHDQGEALCMADRVAVFNEGRIEQIDTPQALYNAPKTAFVARFVGSANVLSGSLFWGSANEIAIRPEYIRLCELMPGEKVPAKHIGILVTIQATLYLGAHTRVDCVAADGTTLSAHLASTDPILAKLASGQKAHAYWLAAHMVELKN